MVAQTLVIVFKRERKHVVPAAFSRFTATERHYWRTVASRGSLLSAFIVILRILGEVGHSGASRLLRRDDARTHTLTLYAARA